MKKMKDEKVVKQQTPYDPPLPLIFTETESWNNKGIKTNPISA